MRRLAMMIMLGAGGIAYAQPPFSYAKPGIAPIRRVCLMPVEAHLSRLGMKGGESMVADSDVWGIKIAAMLQGAIRDTGAEIQGDLSLDALKNENQRESVLQVREKYQNISVQMRKKRSGVKKGRYTLGDQVTLLPCAEQADAIAFIDASGTLKTGGRKTFSVLTGGVLGVLGAMARYDVTVALADAKSGDILILLLRSDLGGRSRNDPEKAFRENIATFLKQLHVGS